MSALLRDEEVQSAALLTILQAASVPIIQPRGLSPREALVAVRPTFRAWQMPWHEQRYAEQQIRSGGADYWCVVQHKQSGYYILWAKLFDLAQRAAQWGRHPSCHRFIRWYIDMIGALMRHGWYDPDTGHTPPASQQLNAIERVEEGRDHLNVLLPGMGDFLTGHRPTDPEARKSFGYIVTDDEGNRHFIRDVDLPDGEETDDDDDD